MLADVTGREIRISVVPGATAPGGSVTAATRVGRFAPLAEAGGSMVARQRTVEPHLANMLTDDAAKERWKQACRVQIELADDGATASLRRAPGTRGARQTVEWCGAPQS